MATASFQLSEDQLLCSICLDVFSDPVSTPCGHNFCKSCISTHWTINVPAQCPMCKTVFPTKPKLQTNTFISEMVAQFKQEAQQESSSSKRRSSSSAQVCQPGDVPCDVCTESKQKAVKSCLVCLVSYCSAHLEPHQNVVVLKRHQLIDPVENLEARMCTKHNKPLELFCRTDQVCVCALCPALDHNTHQMVPLVEECEARKTQLVALIQQVAQERKLMVEEFGLSFDLIREDTERERAEGVQIFSGLSELVEGCLNQLCEMLEEKQKTKFQRAKDCIKELEEEISDLHKTSTEVEKLSISEDPFPLLQKFQSLNIHQPPATKDWNQVRVLLPSQEGVVVRAAVQLEDSIRHQVKKLLDVELKRVQQYEVEVSLDPDTAHPCLLLSEDGKQVSPGDVKPNLAHNTKRFLVNPCVLGTIGFSSGRFYFEVQVRGKSEWDCGVARESINRVEDVPLSPDDGYWAIWLRKRFKYKALADPPVHLTVKSLLHRLGVFVDYEEGLVSFHDADTADLIYCFAGCCFNDKLFPYFNPGLNDSGKNSGPLIITPVCHIDHF